MPKPEIESRLPNVEITLSPTTVDSAAPQQPDFDSRADELAVKDRRCKALLLAAGEEIPSTKTTQELESKVRQLTKQQNRQLLESLRLAETVDLCFLMDVTDSMDPYIAAAANSVVQIIEEVSRAHRGRLMVERRGSFRAAFIGYRDIEPETMQEEHTEIIAFTPNMQLFQQKVMEIKVRNRNFRKKDEATLPNIHTVNVCTIKLWSRKAVR